MILARRLAAVALLLGVVIVSARGAHAQAKPGDDPDDVTVTDETGSGSGSGSAPAAPNPPAGAPKAGAAGAPLQLQGRPVERVQFRGNRKVEDDAIRVQLLTKPGTLLDSAKLREDLRAMWKMGFFADIRSRRRSTATARLTLTFAVKEKPSIRKVLIAGQPRGRALEDQRGHRPRARHDRRHRKVKKNRDKIADLYVQKGYYLATVDYEIKPVNEAEVDVWFKIDEKAKVKIREVQFIGNNSISDDELRDAISTRRADALSFLNDSGVYSQEAFERDLLLISAHYWDRGYANVKVGTPAAPAVARQAVHVPVDPDRRGPGVHDRRGRLQGRPDRRRRREPRASVAHARRA